MVWIAENCGFQMLDDDEIVTFVQEESDPVDDETDEDEDNNNKECSKGSSNANAFSALETAKEWYEQQSECYPTQILLLKRVRDLAARKRMCAMVHRKMSTKEDLKVYKRMPEILALKIQTCYLSRIMQYCEKFLIAFPSKKEYQYVCQSLKNLTRLIPNVENFSL
ncbi:uncharacterized protein TNCV_4180771 [Trichonephila clavipes]|nr:uncharacterized protein TNCV_4180771 [Trichonephila clavipes]